MPQLASQMSAAKHNVEPEEDDVANAADAHIDVREALEASPELVDMGIDTILIGSYARRVSIRRMKDVDVFSKLTNVDLTESGAHLLDTFYRVLASAYGEARVDRQDRSIKVSFPGYDLSVDAVPARPNGSHWEIPDKEDGWEPTDPLEFGTQTSAMNARYGEHYVPTVKLIRQARRANLGDSQPGGLYLEIATYHAFDSGLRGGTATEYFCAALDGVVSELARARQAGLVNPALAGSVISTRATDEELEHAEETFRNLAMRAKDALASDDGCRAAFDFRQILGRTSDGDWVFPMPSYCNEDGSQKATSAGIRSGSRSVPESGRFA